MNREMMWKGVLLPYAFVVIVEAYAVFLYLMNFRLVQFIESTGMQFHPFGSTPAGESSTAVLYIVPIIFFTFGLAYMVRRKPRLILPIALGVSLIISSGFITLIVYWWLPLSFIPLLLFTMGIFIFTLRGDKYGTFRLPFQVWLGTGVAMLLALTFPQTTILVFCGAVAVWDMYAVFRGPLGSIAKGMKEEDRSMSFLKKMLILNVGASGIGMGDVVFYSLILMVGVSLGAAALASVFLAVAFGSLVTFYLLRSRAKGPLPGLPLPMLLSLLAIGMVTLL